MKQFPSPVTFAEGQRLIYGWLAAAAGIFCGTCSVLMVCLLMWGNWSQSQEHTIVVIFGGTLAGYVIGMMSVTIGLLVGGLLIDSVGGTQTIIVVGLASCCLALVFAPVSALRRATLGPERAA